MNLVKNIMKKLNDEEEEKFTEVVEKVTRLSR